MTAEAMTDDPDDDHVQPVTSGLPIYTGSNGQAYLACDTVTALLRAIAGACLGNVHHEESAEAFAAAVEQEADNLECRAIARTRHALRGPT
ncbi:hypothetical protein [Streptomyces lasiicapitis]|uniref:hypothetical protein n=1 Tax=Streptomyces lasiicapitis TaxID=1923961 RepID=UPI0036B67D2E